MNVQNVIEDRYSGSNETDKFLVIHDIYNLSASGNVSEDGALNTIVGSDMSEDIVLSLR